MIRRRPMIHRRRDLASRLCHSHNPATAQCCSPPLATYPSCFGQSWSSWRRRMMHGAPLGTADRWAILRMRSPHPAARWPQLHPTTPRTALQSSLREPASASIS
ncbi:uncharacterized protein LOC110201036 isoform X2 [Phascolarctos cinereus]